MGNAEEVELKDIMAYDEAHYFEVDGEIVLGGVITEMSENSNPAESEKQYIHQKSKITRITGFANEFPITMDMVKGDRVFEAMYQKFYRRKTGTDLNIPHFIVNLWEPVEGKTNTYKARKIIQTCNISECTNVAGEQKQIKGSLKGGDFEYGEFNVSTKTFTKETEIAEEPTPASVLSAKSTSTTKSTSTVKE